MAIKKGAFELYTQERKLPEKGQNNSSKASHFFDDSYQTQNGSQSVHNRFTNNNHAVDSQHINIITKLESNIDEVLHDTANDNEHFLNPNIGSQSVHNRFTHEKYTVDIESQITNEDIKTTSSISFCNLIGNQREIIIALYKNMRVNQSDTTEELTLEMISNLAGVNIKSLKNTLFRLTSAGFLIRAAQKNGRGGWVKYRINDQIITEIQQKDFFITLKNKNSSK